MKTRFRMLSCVVAFVFILGVVSACDIFGKGIDGILKDVKKKGESFNVEKADLSKKIKSKKYGSFKFTKKQVKKIKNLKKGKQTYFLDITAKKKVKGKTKKTEIVVLVVRATKKRFQIFCMEKPDSFLGL